jgi:uridine phosphorylase
VVITTASVRLDGASRHFAPIEYPAVANHECTSALVAAAEYHDVTSHLGVTASSDTFYPGQDRRETVSGYIPRSRSEWEQLGVLNYEMESATLLTMCAVNGWRAGMVAGVLVNRHRQEIPDETVHSMVEDNAVQVVVTAALQLLGA